MSANNRPYIYFPFIGAFILIFGMFVGARLSSPIIDSSAIFKLPANSFNKVTEVINYIESEYVDTVNREQLEEIAIQNLLQELDPHSYYIPAAELQALNEPLEGNFEGIGIEFSIQKDTIMVIAPIIGGPSEILGIQAGDRVVNVEGKLVAGVGISNKKVIDLLRGEGGTIVNISIKRSGEKELLAFAIKRDKIPINSIDVAYMVNDSVGYVKLSRFSKNAQKDFVEASNELKNEGMKNLILDLRGNGGGYLDAANRLADEFLEHEKVIVYTEGRSRPKQIYYATELGGFEDLPLYVLIDQGSASASEIIAGAVQDNDRGTIVGRRSFGKGLVQEPTGWPDGSAIRLTIARYYTPTGRCIQKPYDDGSKAYHNDYYERLERGELMSIDSIDLPDSLKFITEGGKVVYGGGGIMPDIFVPLDTLGKSWYYSDIVYKGIIRKFAFNYADEHRAELNKYSDFKAADEKFIISDQLFNDLIKFASENDLERDEFGISQSEFRIRNRLKASILRNVFNDKGFYPIIHQQDNVIKSVLKDINDKNAN